MGLNLGKDSFVTLAQATTYASSRPSAAAWAGLPDSSPDGISRESYLREAYQILISWPGAELPRMTDDDMVAAAQIELAIWLIANYADFASQFGGPLGLSSIRMGNLSMSYTESGAQIPDRIKWMLKNYTFNNNFVKLRP